MADKKHNQDIRLVDAKDYPSILSMIESSKDASASLFLISALRSSSPKLKVYAEYYDSQPVGTVVMLPNLPPFGVPVLLPAGTISSNLLRSIADVESSPQMALGSVKPTSTLAKIWPTKWDPLIAQREEILLQQPSPFRISKCSSLSTRLAVYEDIKALIKYRIAMEKDSGTAIVSTPSEAQKTITALIDQQTLTIVEVHGEIGGCAAISASDNQHEQLGFVYVEPKHRLLGVSDRLLSDICINIHDRGKKPIAFTTCSGSLHNRLLNLGFKKIGEHLKVYFRS